MRKWTCCIISAILIFSVIFVQKGNPAVTLSHDAADPAVNSNLADKLVDGVLEMFMGLSRDEPASKEILIDLSHGEISQEMQVEIERIKSEVIQESQQTPQPQASEPPAEKKPSVLLYHTHTDEAFLKGDQDYVETSAGRTLNPDYSVVRVGKTLKTALEQYGFSVIHDQTDNVSASFKDAYQTSYNTIKKYIGSVDIYIDMHRDAYMGREPNFLKNGEREYAYVCFVVANGENYTQKPNWQENYKLALQLTNKLNELCPGIAKDIIFKNARFNQHISTSCLLIEMGNEKNTLEQVNASAEIVAQAFNEIY